MNRYRSASSVLALILAAVVAAPAAAESARAQVPDERDLERGSVTPTGLRITPQAMPGAKFESLNPNLPALPDFLAGQAASVSIAPDGRTMLVMTSGFNRNNGPDGEPVPALSNEYVFVYDITGPFPVKKQVVQVPNTYLGLAWHPRGDRFFVSGGVDDAVHDFKLKDDGYALDGSIKLGHAAGVGIEVTPQASGIAVSPDGTRLLVANYQNESVSLVDVEARKVIGEQDLRPGLTDPAQAGAPGGTYPNLVAWLSSDRAYVTSQRDRELITLTVTPAGLGVAARLGAGGQPSAIALNPRRSRAYLALDNTDEVMVVDTTTDKVVETIAAAAPEEVWRNPAGLHGANTNGLGLSPDGTTLYVSNGGINAIAVVRLGAGALDPATLASAQAALRAADDAGETGGDEELEKAEAAYPAASQVVGLLPTGWYPTGVAVAERRIYAINGKTNSGPNPLGCRNVLGTATDARDACKDADQYVWQLEKAGLLTMPVPSPQVLARMTWQVAANNDLPAMRAHNDASETMAAVRAKVDHVVYIVKENRTYDQVLGDLDRGNGDPSLVLLPEPISPNHHELAKRFVTLDNFHDSGESSNTGWNWTTAARSTDFTERTSPVNYADRGLQYDWEGENRNVNVGVPTLAERIRQDPSFPNDPNLLAGTADVAAPDGPGAGLVGTGYLWDEALRQGLTIRNYGFYGDENRYDPEHPAHIPPIREPHKDGTTVFHAHKESLAPHTDPYFRGYDMAFPDYWRFREWEREFDQQVSDGSFPNLTLLRFPHDHFGAFDAAIDGVNTVETQMADNDWAVGMAVEKIATSPYAEKTLIFVIEDDAQDGADHVDSHRSIGYVVGPYVKRGAVVSDHYTTVSMLRTIEDVLGLDPLGLNDGLAEPMAEVFDLDQAAWSFEAILPEILRTTQLPLPPAPVRKADAGGCFTTPARTAGYWQAAMQGQDFATEDKLDTEAFNAALWRGLKGEDAPLPGRSGADLSRDREELIAAFRREAGCAG